VVIAVTHLEMLEQLLPFVRFDGYFVLSDLTGVPDLFSRVVPILRSAGPKGRRDPRVTGLRRRARIVVTGWVLCVIPLLGFTLGSMLLYLPAFNRSLWHSVSNAAHLVAGDFAGRHYAAAGPAVIGGALAAMSGIGTVYVMIRLTRRAARVVSRRTAGHPWRRLIAVVAALAIAGSLVLFWASQGQFRGW